MVYSYNRYACMICVCQINQQTSIFLLCLDCDSDKPTNEGARLRLFLYWLWVNQRTDKYYDVVICYLPDGSFDIVFLPPSSVLLFYCVVVALLIVVLLLPVFLAEFI